MPDQPLPDHNTTWARMQVRPVLIELFVTKSKKYQSLRLNVFCENVKQKIAMVGEPPKGDVSKIRILDQPWGGGGGGLPNANFFLERMYCLT